MSSFDQLANIDTTKIAEVLSENQNTLIKFVLIGGSLIMLLMMYNDMNAKEQNFKKQMSLCQDKIQAIQARNEAVVELSDFKSALPKKLNEFELISLISNYAKNHEVTITSLSPAESKNMGIYDLIDMSFNASSDDFKRMVLFLRNIEKSNLPVRINSWSGNESDDGKINFNIDISAVIIHP